MGAASVKSLRSAEKSSSARAKRKKPGTLKGDRASNASLR
jgi:hypothetical protein